MKFTGPDGKTYKSKKEYCSLNGITVGMYDYRIKQKWSEDTLFSEKYSEKHSTCKCGIPVDIPNGKHYDTKAEFCRDYGIKRSTMAKREKRNWTLEEIIIGKRILNES